MFLGDADLLRMRDFLIAANASGRPGYWHIGDLIWGVYQNTLRPTRLDPAMGGGRGRTAGLRVARGAGWRQRPGSPAAARERVLEEQMLDWGVADILAHPHPEPPEVWAKALDSDAPYQAILARRGFQRDDFHYLLMRCDLRAAIPAGELAPGWSVRHVGDE
jgi:hypothetical protein